MGRRSAEDPEVLDLGEIETPTDLARVLRQLRRRHARRTGGSPLTVRELAARTGYSIGSVGSYLNGTMLAPTDKFDDLTQVLGAAPYEQKALATARDRVEEHRRSAGAVEGQRPPRELPLDIPGFTGRQAELDQLDELLTATADSTSVVISAVSGTAGIGKTALALHWAHRVSDRFPGGCLYVDLLGYAPTEPKPPEEALDGFLRSLGVASTSIPTDPAERAARYRTVLAEQRILVVLDNARDADQVRPLLPGTPSCLVVVTSRDRLTGLVARDGAQRIELDLLPDVEAIALLRRLVGERVDAEPDAAAALAERCDRLPLALRIAAELAASRPRVSLVELAAELTCEHRRLDILDAGGDLRTALRAVFSWSYRRLSAEVARAFRLLSLHPGADLDQYAVAALTGTAPEMAGHLINALARAHLVQERAPGRYAMHDLLRAYAREEAAHDDVEADTDTALRRLFDYYQYTAAAAVDVLYPHERHLRPLVTPAKPSKRPDFDADHGRIWLDAELANLVVMSTSATARGWSAYAVELSPILFRDLNVTGQTTAARTIHGNALTAARHGRDKVGEGTALHHLGVLHWQTGDANEALAYLAEALAIRRQHRDQRSVARILNTLGVVYQDLDRYDEALTCHEQAAALFGDLGDRVGEGQARANLGIVCWRRGRNYEALDHFVQDVAISQESKDRNGEAIASGNLGNVQRRLRRYGEALINHARALAIFERNGNRAGIASALTNSAAVLDALGLHQDAVDRHRRAHEIFTELGDHGNAAETMSALILDYQRLNEHPTALNHLEEALAAWRTNGNRELTPETLNNYGTALRIAQRHQESTDCHQSALTHARRIGDPYTEAQALNGIAQTMEATGHAIEATEYRNRAAGILNELDPPEGR